MLRVELQTESMKCGFMQTLVDNYSKNCQVILNDQKQGPSKLSCVKGKHFAKDSWLAEKFQWDVLVAVFLKFSPSRKFSA